MPLLNIPSNPPIESTTDSCALCHDPLLIPSTEAIGASHIIDDVELRCGHHFHWACIMDYSKVNKKAREECALCRASTLDAHGRFIVSIRNEGG
ncbi:hypothetical protein DL93DRAFT_2070385 [Clavulina sp. PMI_390]|nr:hypothetical protein DL93DRAFT_2070385 [Clavulina sp. PMI_390]